MPSVTALCSTTGRAACSNGSTRPALSVLSRPKHLSCYHKQHRVLVSCCHKQHRAVVMGPGQFRVLQLYLALSDWKSSVQCLPTRIRCEYSLQQPGPQGAIFFNSKPGGPIVNVLHYWPLKCVLAPHANAHQSGDLLAASPGEPDCHIVYCWPACAGASMQKEMQLDAGFDGKPWGIAQFLCTACPAGHR